MAIDGNFFQGPFCVHMGVVFQKNALPTLLQFARVKKTYQTHVGGEGVTQEPRFRGLMPNHQVLNKLKLKKHSETSVFD